MASNGRRATVQDDAVRPSSRRRRSARSRPVERGKESQKIRSSALVDSPPNDKPSDLEALRKARLNFINTPADERRKTMKYVGETVTRTPANKADVQHVRKTSGSKRPHKETDPKRKHRHRTVKVADDHSGEYKAVYERHPQEQSEEPQKLDVEETETEDLESGDGQAQRPPEPVHRTRRRRSKASVAPRPSGRDILPEQQRQPARRRKSEPIERIRHGRNSSYGIEEYPTASEHRKTSSSQSPHVSRPSLQRSATTTRSKSDAILATKLSPPRPRAAPSIAGSHVKKGSSIFSTLLRSPPPAYSGLKKVACLTCGSDDVPIIKTAKLACMHRMCHDCLRRIFTMSITDPAHMPPKCCTPEHIPLKHVDKLFDQRFKKTWNRKFQEYTTRDRIYCPSRHCGEWIKPNHVAIENGRKVGKCKRCAMRVCVICNNKMHTSRECPKDPAAKMFVEVAKKEGWQRCFNCSAMVELKEGCNHMTCRCTAEFCMICGNKWKTCDCPWFNYEAVEADRLEHMHRAQDRRNYRDEDARAPIRYQEEIDRRRHQERRDEELAQRMEALGVEEDPSDHIMGEADPGHVFGVGNAAEHFLNYDFRQQARNVLTGNFRQAAQAAERLLNGAVTGRENPLPPAPLNLNVPTPNATNLAAQRLQHDDASNAMLDNVARRRSNHHANYGRRTGNKAAGRAADDSAPLTVPLPPALLDTATRPSVRNAAPDRRASGLGGLFAGGRSQTANERAAEQRIEDWRSDVPLGEPADGVTLV